MPPNSRTKGLAMYSSKNNQNNTSPGVHMEGGSQWREKRKRNRLPPGGEKKWRGCDVGRGGREQVISAMAQGACHTGGRNVGETFSWCVKLDGW